MQRGFSGGRSRHEEHQDQTGIDPPLQQTTWLTPGLTCDDQRQQHYTA